MELFQLFITPFFKEKVKMDNTAMIKKLYDLKEENKKGTPRSNVGGWHSGLDLYKVSEFKDITVSILEHAKECFGHLDVQEKYVPEMTGLWGMINPPGSRNNVHTHPYNYLSGVYYLKVPQNSGNLVFLEPKPQAEVLSPPKIKEASIHLAHSVTWEPKENSLIFFPSWLQHEVQINNSNQDRVILSFNINWRENADS